METKVFLRSDNTNKKVSISSPNKPEISEKFLSKWQKIIDLAAKIIEVPAALIMRINKDTMEVLLKSQNETNPYPVGGKESLGSGLYCETVIGKDRALSIDNALNYREWEDNPDVKLDMISYFGFPIKWSDSESFGTICVLDNKTNELSQTQEDLMEQFKNVIENDLELIVAKKELEYLSFHDEMTGLYNRRYFENEMQRLDSSRKLPVTIMIADLENLKYVNDNFGHCEGDNYIIKAAEMIKESTRSEDIVARIGGDEFAFILPQTNSNEAQKIYQRIKEKENKYSKKEKSINAFSISIGYSVKNKKESTLEEIFKEADREMYANKAANKRNGDFNID